VVAAVLLRAMAGAVGDPARPPRSLTVHYLAAFAAEPAEIETEVVRQGRSLTTVTARAVQNGQPVALALAAFAPSRLGVDLNTMAMPDVPGPDDASRYAGPAPGVPIAEQFSYWLVDGAPAFSGADRAESALWLQPAEPVALDHALLAALTDAYYPVIFAATTELIMTPTVDLTVHFRAPLAEGDTGPWLGVFRTRLAADGFMEEDGEIWRADGVLLAQSRQLALAAPVAG
jgi:acyl-CoA thioesterase